MQLNLGRLGGGYCVYWYEDGKRRRYRLKARTRKEAEAEALDVYKRQHAGSSRSGVRVGDVWLHYARHLADRPTGSTLAYTGKAVLPFFGEYRPDHLTHGMCRAYALERTTRGISTGSVHTELGHLRSALRYAAKVGLIDKAPHIWLPTKPEKDMRILNAGEARALIDACDAPHIRLATILLLGTAGRVGAILDLEWVRVDFGRGTINLRLADSATRKGRAVVPMNPMTRAALQTARDAALSDYVVEYACGPVKSIRKGFTSAVRRSGIGHVRIHDLRHTACVTMLQAGHPIHLVSQIMGHSNPRMVEKTYGRFIPEHMAPAVEALDFMKLRKV